MSPPTTGDAGRSTTHHFPPSPSEGPAAPSSCRPSGISGVRSATRCHAPIAACTLLADAGLDHGMRSCRLGVVARARRGGPRRHGDRQARGGVRPLSPRGARASHRRPRVRSRRAGGGGHPRRRRVHRGLQRRQLQHRVGARRARALPRAQGHRADLRPAARGDLRAPEHPDRRDDDVGREADPADAAAHGQGGSREPRRRRAPAGARPGAGPPGRQARVVAQRRRSHPGRRRLAWRQGVHPAADSHDAGRATS